MHDLIKKILDTQVLELKRENTRLEKENKQQWAQIELLMRMLDE